MGERICALSSGVIIRCGEFHNFNANPEHRRYDPAIGPLFAALALMAAVLVPASASLSPSGCYPLSNKGTCYEPGERCRNSDHGASGVAGDGESIQCADNDGWRWEPA
jgi:hypothetical protein